MEKDRWVRRCWEGKERRGWKDLYGKERVRYYNRNRWGISAKEINEERNNNLCRDLMEREYKINMKRVK